ncbi:MAG: MoaD/ThiS family protein [Dehalococcoidales bacterium]|nr:MoaD/ThiS family protein [Dehalococcoidales bacterium]
MKTRLNIPLILRHLTGNRENVEVAGNTVRECIDDLIRQFPDSRGWFDQNNPTVWIVLNQELVQLNELAREVTEGDDLSLILIIGAG